MSFLCSVVPLSLAIQRLEIAAVDLLKVDVEGDELAVLHGIDDHDWPKIRQVRRTLETRQRCQTKLSNLRLLRKNVTRSTTCF